jgi:hypothetical protein
LGGEVLLGADAGHVNVDVVAEPTSLPLFGSNVEDVPFAELVIVAGGVDCTMYVASTLFV